MRGAGRATFAAILLLIAGTLNIIYGIGALDRANIFTSETRYIFTNLNTMGWVLIVLGVIQLTGGFSLLSANTYGRVIGIIGGSLGAIEALCSIGGANPWWSLAVFFLCVWVVYGIPSSARTSASGQPNPEWVSFALGRRRLTSGGGRPSRVNRRDGRGRDRRPKVRDYRHLPLVERQTPTAGCPRAGTSGRCPLPRAARPSWALMRSSRSVSVPARPARARRGSRRRA